MPTVPQTIRFREYHRNKEQHNPLIRSGLGCGLLVSLLGVILTLVGFWFYADITQDLPSVDVIPSLLEPPDGTLLQPTRLFDRTHQHILLTLENPAAVNKQYLHVAGDDQSGESQFSQNLIDATIAMYDPTFWSNPGYLMAGLFEGTHLTLAQRLISELVLSNEPASLKRNIRERLLAAQIITSFGREKVLEWYLNSAQYGDLIYGADAAAQAYFGKSATDLTISEAALLTAIAERPAIIPVETSQLLMEGQRHVIQAMLVEGMINGEEAQRAILETIHLRPPVAVQNSAPAFTNLVLKQLGEVMPLERVIRGGYEVVTTLDYDLQLQVLCTVEAHIARLQGMQAYLVAADGSPCEAALLLPTLVSDEGSPPQDLAANVVILDPHLGQIIAMVGDTLPGLDPALLPGHPGGTLLTPFLYLTAFTRGSSPATLIWDIPETGSLNDPQFIENESNPATQVSFHGPVRLRMAFSNDYLGAAAQVLGQVGAENVWLTEKQFGITTTGIQPTDWATLSDFLMQETILLESVQAYAVLANQGIMEGQPTTENTTSGEANALKPTSLIRAQDVQGQVLLDWSTPQARPIVTPQLAYLTTNILSDETARWRSLGHPNPLEVGRPAAAKVGVTATGEDAWAVGYIPQLAIGVWVGHTEGEPNPISVEIPSALWHALIQYASRQMPVQNFPVPPGITTVQVCDPSGLLPSEFCPAVVQEVFLNGTEPTQVDNLYQKFYINRETGLLATIFTPPELLDEQVYLVIPPQAVPWAQESGLPIPPDSYDVIYAPPPASTNVQFASPEMFAHVGGQVEFYGSASGSNFSYYRLQVGQGLNPQQWIQIGQDVDLPVENGLLGTWDTQGLEGLYVVQLMVVRQDQQVERAILQLTVDNTLPQVQILNPIEAEQFAYHQGESILLQVSAGDNLVLDRVEFYVDGRLVSTLLQPPFVVLWSSRIGEHNLVVRAYDLAGNLRETATSFSVQR